ncbi:unnamed protein product [Protopolystoma xenopodis]|uniref:Uncharacterized protein n=1 Tax=Protopolystoma xenopodis TaxID=117903 RepID=A0A3S5CLP8_9PLAT|nr:unnamed protein product [Protopolystoma xenopodis]
MSRAVSCPICISPTALRFDFHFRRPNCTLIAQKLTLFVPIFSSFQVDEDKKTHEQMHNLIERLQSKLQTYKIQIETTEEIAAVNLAKYRKIQHEIEDSEERADQAEQALQKLRARNRSSLPSTKGISMGLLPVSSTACLRLADSITFINILNLLEILYPAIFLYCHPNLTQNQIVYVKWYLRQPKATKVFG